MTPLVTAVLVLYKLAPEASASFTSLRQILLERPDWGARVTLLVYDNSPEPHALPPFPAPATYLHNKTNPGLATAYNTALAGTESEWLLLLDQDTTLTAEYLEEAFAILPTVGPEVVALFPQLVQGGHVHSPQRLPRLSHRPLDPGFHGVCPDPITAFNSGAIVRVSALRSIGGFPAEFALDFLDHAVYHRLAAAGGSFFVMRSQLAHDLSTSSLGGDASLARYRNVLACERRFHQQTGGAQAWWYRLRRLKQAAGHLLKVSDKRFAWHDLRAAFGFIPD